MNPEDPRIDLSALRTVVEFWLAQAVNDRAVHKTHGPEWEQLVDSAVGAICRQAVLTEVL